MSDDAHLWRRARRRLDRFGRALVASALRAVLRLSRRWPRELDAALQGVGLDAYPRVPGNHYVPAYFGVSAHKQADIRTQEPFATLADRVISARRTLLYYDRLHTLWQLTETLARTRPAREIRAAEVGVYRGGTSRFLAEACRELGMHLRLHAFDTFRGHPAGDVRADVDAEQEASKFSSTDAADVKDYLGAHPGIEIHEGRFQETCAAVEDLCFDLVHLDVDLYAPTAFALRFFRARMRVGAAIVVDDHGSTTCPGVARAVGEFVAEAPEYLAIPQLTGQCVLVRTRQEQREHAPG